MRLARSTAVPWGGAPPPGLLWAVDHGVGGVDGQHLAERGGGPCPQAVRGQGPCPQHAMGGRSRRGPCRRPACAAERPRSGNLPRVASAAVGRLRSGRRRAGNHRPRHAPADRCPCPRIWSWSAAAAEEERSFHGRGRRWGARWPPVGGAAAPRRSRASARLGWAGSWASRFLLRPAQGWSGLLNTNRSRHEVDRMDRAVDATAPAEEDRGQE